MAANHSGGISFCPCGGTLGRRVDCRPLTDHIRGIQVTSLRAIESDAFEAAKTLIPFAASEAKTVNLILSEPEVYHSSTVRVLAQSHRELNSYLRHFPEHEHYREVKRVLKQSYDYVHTTRPKQTQSYWRELTRSELWHLHMTPTQRDVCQAVFERHYLDGKEAFVPTRVVAKTVKLLTGRNVRPNDVTAILAELETLGITAITPGNSRYRRSTISTLPLPTDQPDLSPYEGPKTCNKITVLGDRSPELRDLIRDHRVEVRKTDSRVLHRTTPSRPKSASPRQRYPQHRSARPRRHQGPVRASVWTPEAPLASCPYSCLPRRHPPA